MEGAAVTLTSCGGRQAAETSEAAPPLATLFDRPGWEHMQRLGFLARNSLRYALYFALVFSCLAVAGIDESSAATHNYYARPTISGSPPTAATVGQPYSFTPTASAPRNIAIHFSISNRPAWAAFNTSTGTLSGTPTATNVGVYSSIVIKAYDRFGSAALPAFSITVASATTPAAQPPVISGSPPPTVTAGSAYSFQPTASDPSGKALSFSIQNKPSWASFSIATGAVTGTPTTAQEGTYSNIVITASDGTASASLKAFSISVVAPVAGPSISGTPATSVTAGSAYSFTPTTQNPNGGTLTYSVQNKPAWASFNTNTGLLSGTPLAVNVGSYSGIVISVSDGTSSAALPAFAITVNAAAGGTTTGSATISWTAPTQNVDGTPLTDLAGYRIYYGTSAASLSNSVTIASSTATSYTIGNLSSATWYFAVSSYASTGQESALSNIGSKTIP